jgi:DNA-binding NtrC family response regulator
MTNSIASASNSIARILVCTGDAEVSREIAETLSQEGHHARHAASFHFALDELRREPVDVCVVGDSCISEIRQALREEPALASTQLVRLSAKPSADARQGSLDCEDVIALANWERNLPSLVASAAKRARLVAQNRRLQAELQSRSVSDFIGTSTAMQRLRQQIRIASEQDVHILIRGQRGTGTRKLAHAVHVASPRAEQAFVRANCKILTADALHRELFGDEHRPGALKAARGGTLFVDEIGAMPQSVQRRLLAELPRSPSRTDIRVLAAAHDDLARLAAEGRVLPELVSHFAIAVRIPALSEHREDVPAIAEEFLTQFALREGRPVPVLLAEAMQLLEDYNWPGNTAELYNVLERACTLGTARELTADEIRPWLGDDADAAHETIGLSLREMERKLIETTFARCGGNRELTAKSLRIGLRTLSGKLREYGYPPRGGPGSNIPRDRRKAA